jgi:hypothetical protein
MFNDYEEFRRTRVIHSAWRRREVAIRAMGLPEWQETLYRRVLRAPYGTDNDEHRLYAHFVDQLDYMRGMIPVQRLRPATPTPPLDNDGDETETEAEDDNDGDDNDGDDNTETIQFVSVAPEELAAALDFLDNVPAATPPTTPPITPTTPVVAASRKRSRDDSDDSPEPIAKRTRSRTRSDTA